MTSKVVASLQSPVISHQSPVMSLQSSVPSIDWRLETDDWRLNVDHETIIGQLDAARQRCARLRVAEIVRDVREVRAIGAHARDGVERLIDVEVRRVRTAAQRVDDYCLHAVEQRPR